MDMTAVRSTNVAAVGYDPVSRTMRVQFRSGGVYDYFDVDPALFSAMQQPHPWRRLGGRVTRHRWVKVT